MNILKKNLISDFKYFKFKSVKYFCEVKEKEDIAQKYKGLIEAMNKDPKKIIAENEKKYLIF
jgi:hypothetical protein